MGLQSTGSVAWAVAVLSILAGCGGSSPPDAPAGDAPPPAGGAIVVSGTERLNWVQSNDRRDLAFLAYVDGNPVALDDATCDWATAEAQCHSALPSMTDGVHAIALAARTSSGLESPQSEAVTVQKVSARSVVSASSVPNDAFVIDVVARGLRGPVQLASTPDGRLLIAEGDLGVRVVPPGAAGSADLALDARVLQPPPAGGLGLAVHPDFARNHFVYVSFLSRDRADQTILRVVRLREAGNTLGEASTLFEAPLVTVPEASRPGGDTAAPSASAERLRESPRLGFGPDGLLYALLPAGLQFVNEPAASTPHASMLRVDDEGRAPRTGALAGITAHPLGFAWHPSTAALWLILPGTNGEALVQPGGVWSASSSAGIERGVLRMTEDAASSSGALMLRQAGALDLARMFPQGVDPESIGVLRLMMPVLAEGVLPGVAGRITDMVPSGTGALYLTTNDGGGLSSGSDAVLRLTPRIR